MWDDWAMLRGKEIFFSFLRPSFVLRRPPARRLSHDDVNELVNKQHECINESMQTAEWFVTTTTLILFHRKPVKDTEGERLAPRARVSSPKK